MYKLRKWILAAAMSFCASAFANTYTTELSDLWYNRNESGWGLNVSHQREVAFLTFYIYGPDGRATWYTGETANTGQNAQGALVFSGSLYQFTGPAFTTVPFDSTKVIGRSVGTVTFTAFLDKATLTYTIDGATVSKELTRYTFRVNDMSGEYIGAIKQSQSSCRAPYVNGDLNRNTEFSVVNSPSTFSMNVRQPDGTVCNYSGNYTQGGRLGRSQGSYSCPGGVTGLYDLFEIEASVQGFLGRYIATDNFCDSTIGRFAAMRK